MIFVSTPLGDTREIEVTTLSRSSLRAPRYSASHERKRDYGRSAVRGRLTLEWFPSAPQFTLGPATADGASGPCSWPSGQPGPPAAVALQTSFRHPVDNAVPDMLLLLKSTSVRVWLPRVLKVKLKISTPLSLLLNCNPAPERDRG
jgi:hypothetical protein